MVCIFTRPSASELRRLLNSFSVWIRRPTQACCFVFTHSSEETWNAADTFCCFHQKPTAEGVWV